MLICSWAEVLHQAAIDSAVGTIEKELVTKQTAKSVLNNPSPLFQPGRGETTGSAGSDPSLCLLPGLIKQLQGWKY